MPRLGFFTVTFVAIAAACTTETVVVPNPGAAAPGNEDPTNDGGTPDASPDTERSVKGTWEKVTVAPPDGEPIRDLSDVFVRSATDVYVTEGASNLGTGYYHFDGTGWTGVRYPGLATSFHAPSTGELLAYGDIFVMKTGDGWGLLPQPQNTGAPALIYSLAGPSFSNLFASTNAGNLRFNGSTWIPMTGIESRSGQFATVGGETWFASFKSTSLYLARSSGGSFTDESDALPAEVEAYPIEGPYGIFGTAPDDVWAIGRPRTLIHKDASGWSIVPGPDDEWGCDLVRGWASSKKNAWLIGRGGCIFHWDGAAWEKIPSGVTENLYSIHGADAENVWITFQSTTTVLRLVPE